MEVEEAPGKDELWGSRFLDTVGSVMGTQARAREGRWDTSYINAAWVLPTKGRDITAVGETVIRRLFGHTRSGRHKYAKANRRRELKGAVRLLDQNDELVW